MDDNNKTEKIKIKKKEGGEQTHTQKTKKTPPKTRTKENPMILKFSLL